MINVLLTDDQRIIRDGLRALLETYGDIHIVGEAANGEEAYRQTQILRPDIVLMDIRMPLMDGVEATRQIKKDFPKTVIIILTTFDDDEYIINAMTYGASGYLLKDISGDKLIDAIRDGIKGNIILPGLVAAKITSKLVSKKSLSITQGDFSEREIDIIQLMIKGKSNKEIAETVYLSLGTVKNYISQIYLKIDVNDRANAVIFFKEMEF